MSPVLLIIYGFIYIPLFAIGIVVMVLLIKLMRRGIISLDKYIEFNSKQ